MNENEISVLQEIRFSGKNNIVKYNCCSWSQSDRFFVLTELGVEILILVPQPKSSDKQFYFKRSFIPYASKENNHDKSVDPKELYDRDTLLERLLEKEKSLPFISKDESFDHLIISAAWAPVSLLPALSPLLAVLKVSGILTIFSTDQITKYPTFNVTEIFSDENREDRLTASMIWFELEDVNTKENKHFLVCGQLSGSVRLLESSVTSTNELQLTLIREVANVNCRPNIINYISGNHSLILVGTINGKLYAASLHKDDPVLILWPHEDNIQINTINAIDHEDATYIFITKQTHLILFIVKNEKLISDPKILKTETLPFVAAAKINDTIFFQTLGSDLFYIENDTVKSLKWPSDLWRYQAANGVCFSPSGAIGVVFANDTRGHKRKIRSYSSNLIIFNLPISLITKKEISQTYVWDKLELRRILLINNKHSNDHLDCLIDKTFNDLQIKLWTEQNDSQQINYLFEKILQESLVKSLKFASISRDQWTDEKKEIMRHQYRYVLSCDDLKSKNLNILKKIEKKLGQIAQGPARQCLWCDEHFDGILCSEKHPRQWCFISLRDIVSESLSCPLCHATAEVNIVPVPKSCIFCNSRLITTRYLSNQTKSFV